MLRLFTALITRTADHAAFEAVSMDLPLPVVTGRSLAEVQDNLLTAMQHHIDLTCELTCEAATAEKGGAVGRAESAIRLGRVTARQTEGTALLLKIPEYLLTRN